MDPGIFAGVRGGGGGVQVQLPENSSDVFLCFTYFTVLQRVSNGYLKENYNFPRFQRGSNIFQGGGGGGGGPNASFYRNRLSPL